MCALLFSLGVQSQLTHNSQNSALTWLNKMWLSGAPNKNQEKQASIPKSAKLKEVTTLKLEAKKWRNISKMIFKSCIRSNGIRTTVSSGLMLDKFNHRQTATLRQIPRSYPDSHVRFTAGINISTNQQPSGLRTFQGISGLAGWGPLK